MSGKRHILQAEVKVLGLENGTWVVRDCLGCGALIVRGSHCGRCGSEKDVPLTPDELLGATDPHGPFPDREAAHREALERADGLREQLAATLARSAKEKAKHDFRIRLTGEVGDNTGRPRYKVLCLECRQVIHPGTTGPMQMIRNHTDFGFAWVDMDDPEESREERISDALSRLEDNQYGFSGSEARRLAKVLDAELRRVEEKA